MGAGGRASRRAWIRVPRGGWGPAGVGAPDSERRPHQVLGANHRQQSDAEEGRDIGDPAYGNVLLVSAGDSDANADAEGINVMDWLTDWWVTDWWNRSVQIKCT